MSGETFFVSDVETTGLEPGGDGELATIGIVALNDKGQIIDSWYDRVGPENTIVGRKWDPATRDWWHERSIESEEGAQAYEEVMYPKPTKIEDAADAFYEWVLATAERDEKRYRIFLSSPIQMDFLWLERLVSFSRRREHDWGSLFTHRTMCVRTAMWAIEPTAEAHASMRWSEPKIPHHALHDATGSALDFAEVMRRRHAFGAMLARTRVWSEVTDART